MSETKLKQAKIYLIWVISAFVIGFIITISLVYFSIRYGFTSPLSPLTYGIMGGFVPASMTSGVILFVRFIVNKPEWLKIVCGVLFLVVFVMVYLIGIVTWIPYTCYNIIYLINHHGKVEESDTHDLEE